MHLESFCLGGETLAVGSHSHIAGTGWRAWIEAFIQSTEAVLDFLVGVVDIARHLALQHTHTVKNLAGFGKALFHTTARLFQQALQLARVCASRLLTLQALLDKADNPPGDLLRGVVIGFTRQSTGLKAKALGKTIGQGGLCIGSWITDGRLGSGRSRTRWGG